MVLVKLIKALTPVALAGRSVTVNLLLLLIGITTCLVGAFLALTK